MSQRLRSLLALAVALIAAIFALSANDAVAASPVHQSSLFNYGSCHDSTLGPCTSPGRGPPSSAHAYTSHDVVDSWSRGVSASPDDATAPAIYDYNHPASLLQAVGAAATTQEVGRVTEGHSVVFLRSSVAANTRTHAVPIGPGSEKAWTVLNRVDGKGAPLPGYKGGKTFQNSQGRLPDSPGVTYREWDVNPHVKGIDRGAERLVTGSDGSAYFTNDHYDTFVMLRGPTG